MHLKAITLALAMTHSAAAQEAVTWQDNVQGWHVAIDRTIDNSCFIISRFANDQYMRLQINAVQETLQMIVASPAWATLQSGENYDVEVAFDDLEAWPERALGHRWKDILPSLVLSFPISDAQTGNFLEDLTQTQSFHVYYGGVEIADFGLRGVDGAVAAMLECQRQMARLNDVPQAEDDPFATEKGQT